MAEMDSPSPDAAKGPPSEGPAEPSPIEPAKFARFAPLRHAAFRAYCGMRASSVLATQMQSVAIGWQVYDLARRSMDVGESAFLLGMVGATQFLPLIFLSLYGGQAADRYNRRNIVMICVLAKAAISLLLLTTSFMEPGLALPAIFAAAAITGGVNAFLPPAQQSLLSTIVPRSDLPQAVALTSLAFQSGAIIGPAIGGLIYALGPSLGISGPQAAYGVSLALFLAGGVLAAQIQAPPHTPIVGVSAMQLMREGLVYVRRNKIVLGAISLDLAVVLLAGATALLPAFARDILKSGPETLGLLRAAPALGAAGMAFTLSLAPIRRHVGRWLLGTTAVFGFATIGFALSHFLWLSVPLLAIAGAADMISVFVRNSLVQLATPDAMRGRVSAVAFIFVSASNDLGEFESGVAARFLGPVGAVLLGGGAALALAAIWPRLFPKLAAADSFQDAGIVTETAARGR